MQHEVPSHIQRLPGHAQITPPDGPLTKKRLPKSAGYVTKSGDGYFCTALRRTTMKGPGGCGTPRPNLRRPPCPPRRILRRPAAPRPHLPRRPPPPASVPEPVPRNCFGGLLRPPRTKEARDLLASPRRQAAVKEIDARSNLNPPALDPGAVRTISASIAPTAAGRHRRVASHD